MCSYPPTTFADRTVVHFARGELAAQIVAGLPAVARVAREVTEAGLREMWVVTEDGWQPSSLVLQEVARLAPATTVHWARHGDLQQMAKLGSVLLLSGERLPDADTIRGTLSASAEPVDALTMVAAGASAPLARLAPSPGSDELHAAARRIVAGTAKPGDGIVSQLLNRPLSQAISRFLLRWPGIRPIHATWFAAMLGLVMVSALVTGTPTGLIVGAVLFQLASIVDGVDGEIARATFRSTPQGARADSLVDALTNVGFIGGVVINLWIQGYRLPVYCGAGGLLAMTLGLALIGARAGKSGNQFTFNGVKEHFNSRDSALMQWLTWLTMRDFYAFAGMLFVVSGHASAGLVAFSVVAFGWLIVVLSVHSRRLA